MFNHRLKELRKTLKISVEELSKITEIKARTIGEYERTNRSPSIELVTQLCKTLNVNPVWFLTGEGSMFIETPANDENALAIKLKKGQILKVEYEE